MEEEDLGIIGASIIIGAGGEIVVIPYLVGSLGMLYSAGKMADNIRYWNDYCKNTGHRPKYPFRSRSMDWIGYGLGGAYSFSRLKRL